MVRSELGCGRLAAGRRLDIRQGFTAAVVAQSQASFRFARDPGSTRTEHISEMPTARPSGCLLDCRPTIRNLRQRFSRS